MYCLSKGPGCQHPRGECHRPTLLSLSWVLTRSLVLTASVLLALAACDPSEPNAGGDLSGCVEPPDTTPEPVDAAVTVTIEPVVATAGSTLRLRIEKAAGHEEAITFGEGTLLRCWTEAEGWTPTHILTKESSAEDAEAVPWVHDQDLHTGNTLEGWGAVPPADYFIKIPEEIPPGFYQVAEPAWGVGRPFEGPYITTIVEVVAGR